MGCDIHPFIEVKEGKIWKNHTGEGDLFCKYHIGEVDLGRN